MAKEKGILALFDSPAGLVAAITKVRQLNLTLLETYTPFPIHGLDEALGLKRSRIPWFTLLMGLTGAGLGFLFQTWTSAFDWPLNIGGKPYVSWPAFIPITFELMVLIGGVSTVAILFAVLKLPCFAHPVLDERLTNDLFGLLIREEDPRFDELKVHSALKECHAQEVKKVG